MKGQRAAGDRPASLALARVHLRTGALALARAELEAAAGDRRLDDDAIVDLAEARWRTGDTMGAGQAAAAHLGAGGDDLVALVIAAEAAAIGRGGAAEAEALVAQVLDRRQAPMADLVAGMPLAAPWPRAMDDDPPQTEARDLGGLVETGTPGRAIAPLVSVGAGRAISRAVGGPVSTTAESATAADPQAAFAAGSDALTAGDRDAASLHLAVALRLSPALAPAILSVVGGTPGPAFDLLRGDAFRLVGHESDARRAYAAVARSLATRDEQLRSASDGAADTTDTTDTTATTDAADPTDMSAAPGSGVADPPDLTMSPRTTPQEEPS